MARPSDDTSKADERELEARLLHSLRRIAHALDLASRRLAASCGLTGPQLLVMRVLGERSEVSPSELARATCLTQATITGILQRLEQRALLGRARDADDRRRHVIRLTDEGRALLERAPTALHEPFSERYASLDLGDRAMLEWALRRVADMMAATSDEE